MADMNISGIYDAVSIQEDVTLELSDLGISVNSTCTVTESVGMMAEFNISVSDTIAVAEDITFANRIYTDPRSTHWPKLPVWSLEATTPPRMTIDEKAPTWSIAGYFGSFLDLEIPVRSLGATGVEQLFATLDEKIPTHSIEGYFGASTGELKAPVWEIEAESLSLLLWLDKIMPGWSIAVSMSTPVTMVLDGYIPARNILASISRDSWGMTLDKSLSFYKIEGTIVSGYLITLDEKIPVWESDSTIYSGSMILDATMPVWIMGGIGTGDAPDGQPGYVLDPTRYADHILQYVRS